MVVMTVLWRDVGQVEEGKRRYMMRQWNPRKEGRTMHRYVRGESDARIKG